MSRLLMTIATVAALWIPQLALAEPIPGSQTRVGNWSIAAYDHNGKFSHCAMGTPYRSGITMLFSMSGNFTWRVGWAHPSWNFAKGQSVDIVVFVDGAGPYYLTATATSKDVAVAELPPKASVFDVMRKGYLMTVHAVGNVYKFNLDGTYAALTAVLACASRYAGAAGNAAPPPPPQPLVPRTAASHPPAESVTAEERLEATKVVANILAQGEMTGFRILTAREIADLKTDYFSKSDVVWKAEGVIGTLRIIPKSMNATARDVANAVLADDLKTCKGESVSGSTKDEKNPGVLRMFTGCKDSNGGYETRYTVLPLGDGSYYLFATASKLENDGKDGGAAKADSLLRQAVFEVLKK